MNDEEVKASHVLPYNVGQRAEHSLRLRCGSEECFVVTEHEHRAIEERGIFLPRRN